MGPNIEQDKISPAKVENFSYTVTSQNAAITDNIALTL